LTFPVAREHAGQRLDRFVQSRIPRLSRTRAQEIVRACASDANGRRRRASERVRAGEIVLIVRPPLPEPETPHEFGVVHDDEDVLGVDKPAGLPVHPSATYHKHTLTWLLRQRYGDPTPRIAHRLDRETSGVVVCGKHPLAERALKLQFEHRQVTKRYLAIVRGRVEADAGSIDAPMERGDPRDYGGLHLLMEIRPEGVPAETRYEVVERKAGATLVSLEPLTGRQHQLRVHLASIGHPIIGDKLYGPERVAPFLEIIERGLTADLVERLGHDRQALHAHRVTLAHPRDGTSFAVVAPLPPDLSALWDRLGSQGGSTPTTRGSRLRPHCGFFPEALLALSSSGSWPVAARRSPSHRPAR
jgi:23S rRNA pseudouridine1911/1915/1917 synthase